MLRLAWRNLWRNTRRTLVTLSALALGVTGIVTLHSYRESAYGQLTRTLTDQLVGHVQVHGRGYQESPALENLVKDPVAVTATISGLLPGVRSERRVIGAGLGGARDNASGVVIMGLEAGSSGTGMLTVKEGRGLSATPAKEAVIGLELAAQLGLTVGGELVLVGQAIDGSVANDRYTVVGLGDAGTSELNATAVFLHLADAQDFFGLGDGVHQVVLHLPTDEEDVSGPLAAVRAGLDLRTLEALSWNELLPELRSTMETKRKGQHVVDFIVFLIVGLGVLNAMTMSTFERTREFGVMMSLGARPSRVLRLVVTEALLQGALGLAVGLALSAGVLLALGTVSMGGISSGDILGVRMPSSIELRLAPASIVAAVVTVLATMLAGGLLPAWRASRLEPADAVRAE